MQQLNCEWLRLTPCHYRAEDENNKSEDKAAMVIFFIVFK
jgi:hypothetical protein